MTSGQPPPDSDRGRFHQQLHTLFLEMGLQLEQATADETAREQLYQQMRTRLLAFAQQDWQVPDCQRLARRIEKHLDCAGNFSKSRIEELARPRAAPFGT